MSSTTDLPLRQNTSDLENDKFATDGNSKITVRTTDDCAIDVLNSILTELGGSSDTTNTIYNVTLGPVNTEQSQVLPAGTKEFLVKTRGTAPLKLAFVSTESGTKYVTIPRNGVYTNKNMYTALTIYFQSPQTGDIVEIVAYS